MSKYEGFPEKNIEKRLETIDGVEIASSYKEYIELALNDLDDRLNKSNSTINDFRERIQKRTKLLNEITNEVNQRKTIRKSLEIKEKTLRNVLVKNTEIKSAVENLANVAQVKLASSHDRANQFSINNLNIIEIIDQDGNLTNERNKEPQSTNTYNLDSLKHRDPNNTYIQTAYDDLNEILTHDKRVLIELAKSRLENEYKIKEFEKLQQRVETSLQKIKELENNLSKLINHDNDVKEILRQLKDKNILHPDDRKKLFKLIGFYKKNIEI